MLLAWQNWRLMFEIFRGLGHVQHKQLACLHIRSALKLYFFPRPFWLKNPLFIHQVLHALLPSWHFFIQLFISGEFSWAVTGSRRNFVVLSSTWLTTLEAKLFVWQTTAFNTSKLSYGTFNVPWPTSVPPPLFVSFTGFFPPAAAIFHTIPLRSSIVFRFLYIAGGTIWLMKIHRLRIQGILGSNSFQWGYLELYRIVHMEQFSTTILHYDRFS